MRLLLNPGQTANAAASTARNAYAKLPDRDRERVKHAYWQAFYDAISEQDAKQRLQALVDDLDVSRVLYSSTHQQCSMLNSVRVLVRHAFAATALRPRFAPVAPPSGLQLGPDSQRLFDTGCVGFAFAVPADNKRSVDVLL